MSAVLRTIVDLWRFLRVRKRLWLAPVLLTLAIIAALVLWLGSTAAGPFVYTLF